MGLMSLVTTSRRWLGGLVPNSNLTLGSPGIAASTGSSTFGPLYSLYRIDRFFTDGLNYTFEGIQGNYFVRLYFCPFSPENYNVNESSFSIVANGLKLVSKFNVPGET